MSIARGSSPPLPNFEDPLVFQAEWLRPTQNDVHSRSRLQCLMLTYLCTASLHLTSIPKVNVLRITRHVDRLHRQKAHQSGQASWKL